MNIKFFSGRKEGLENGERWLELEEVIGSIMLEENLMWLKGV